MLYRVLERLAVIPHLLWLRLVEVCIFCLCVLSPLQVAAVYKDPSVGNLINIVIVKLIVVHNEQVSAALAFHSPGPCRCLWPGPCSGRTGQPCQSQPCGGALTGKQAIPWCGSSPPANETWLEGACCARLCQGS